MEGEKQYATLQLPDGRSFQFQVKQGSMGPPVIDMSQLYGQTGYFSHDPGFTSTSSCNSAITFIDGEQGELLYRGYRIQDLANQCSYVEVCYLLLYGELPTAEDLATFEDMIISEMCIHEDLIQFYKAFESHAHPMAIMVGVVGALSSFFDVEKTGYSKEQREQAAIRIVAKMPMIAAVAYRTAMGLPVVYPKREFSYTKNFLYMMYKDPMSDTFECDDFLVEALEKILILHADHEQNASTSTVRIAGSSLANPYACIAAGIASLWGPMHGGANEAVLDMLRRIGTPDKIDEFFSNVIHTKKERLMGFGHRVYKNMDPRNEPIKQIAHEMMSNPSIQVCNEELLDLAKEVEQRALQEAYFVQRKLYPNVDYYSGIVLQGIGIPVQMFTVIFALARTIGWISQWAESMSEAPIRIQRPRQLYTGAAMREFVPIASRTREESLIAGSPDTKRRVVMSPKRV